MQNYLCDFSVNNTRTREIVIANSQSDAKKIIEAKYGSANITWWRCNRQY